jgi:hypothetical protein
LERRANISINDLVMKHVDRAESRQMISRVFPASNYGYAQVDEGGLDYNQEVQNLLKKFEN